MSLHLADIDSEPGHVGHARFILWRDRPNAPPDWTETMSETHSGGCLCGGVKYVVTGPLRDVINCHCGQCRRTHGHFAGYTEAPLSDFKLESSESLKWYQSSPQARRGFCSICGASLFWVPEGGDHVWIAAGTLDPPTGLRTVAHTYVADAGDYYTIADDLKTYPGTHLTTAVDK